jgi:uncharacterized membrane protein (UPF0127 family)
MDVETLIDERGIRLRAEVPTSRRERARGLLGRERLVPGSGLLLERTRSIHTIGMRFEIAVAFLDADLRIVQLVRVPPGRIVMPRRGARHVLELGTDTRLRPGDRLRRSS